MNHQKLGKAGEIMILASLLGFAWGVMEIVISSIARIADIFR